MSIGKALPPAVAVQSREEAAAALALAGPAGVLLLSAEGAAGFLGVQGWRALVAAATAPHAGVTPPWQDALCCGSAAGDALAALRAGCRIVVLDGTSPAFAAVAGAAADSGALLLPARPPALAASTLDLRRPQGRTRLAAWLARPHDRPESLR